MKMNLSLIQLIRCGMSPLSSDFFDVVASSVTGGDPSEMARDTMYPEPHLQKQCFFSAISFYSRGESQ